MHRRLADVAPQLESILRLGHALPAEFAAESISRETVWVSMRDGVRLATDLYRPPRGRTPAVAVRTPYGRIKWDDTFVALARHGYTVIAQDCRGTGESEPATWDYYVYEPEDSFDLVEWTTQQAWFGGFLGACGSSYMASTQWCMAGHPQMSTIVPEVAGIGVTFHTAHLYMFLNAYVRCVGKGKGKVPIHYSEMERQMVKETLAGGFFNEPLTKPIAPTIVEQYPHLRQLPPLEARRLLWKQVCESPPAQRVELLKKLLNVSAFDYVAMQSLLIEFGYNVAFGAHSLPSPNPAELAQRIRAPAMLLAGWYDWNLNGTLATWDLLTQRGREAVRTQSRLVITPSAHNVPGYHEGANDHPELTRTYRTPEIIDLLLLWFETIQSETVDDWPPVSYYLMGANEWYAASAWPPPMSDQRALYLGPGGTLTSDPRRQSSDPDRYTYRPEDPTPTVGGSIVSYVYPPGSVDVGAVQERTDVLVYTTPVLTQDLDVVGPIRMILYASSSAVDTDFVARLSDVFPDGRAIQLQSGILRARYRDPDHEPQLLEPGRVYRLEIDMWATANRFKAGNRIRVDISSADFPRFDRNTNRGGSAGSPVSATQTIFHDVEHPSHIVFYTPKEGLEAGDDE